MGGIIADKPVRARKLLVTGSWLGILLLVMGGFAARVVWLDVFPSVNTSFDQSTYRRQADKLNETNLPEWDYAQQAPGYIVFLAANFAWVGGHNKNEVRLIQSLLGAVSVALTFGITQLVFAPLARRRRTTIALLAAALWAFYPDALFFAQTYYSETLFVVLAMGAFYLLLRAYCAPQSGWWLVFSGMVWGLTALTREAAAPFVLIGAPLWLLLTARQNKVKRAGIFLGACLVVILPWTVRNFIRTETFTLISRQGAGICGSITHSLSIRRRPKRARVWN